jgi:hypothetical protein
MKPFGFLFTTNYLKKRILFGKRLQASAVIKRNKNHTLKALVPLL